MRSLFLAMGYTKSKYNQLSDNFDISDYINFAENIIRKYDWTNDIKKNLCNRLQSIKNKQEDECLNLSVIGEFTTGKSTFINALLGTQLLVSSVIQGTTLVNTIIEYSDNYTICIVKTDGTRKTTKVKSVASLSACISDATTNPRTARSIKMVRVGFPSKLLAEGIRIIDTPGTNSLENWHEDVTKEAIRSISDLSIVLTDALHPLPQTLTDFLDCNISDIYNQTAFIVTFFDKVEKSQRKEILKYISKRLNKIIEIENPIVLPFIAPALLCQLSGTTFMPEQNEMVEISLNSLKILKDAMWKNRQIAQIRKLLSLTKDIFNLLETHVIDKQSEYDKRLSMLLRSRQEPLELFINREITKRTEELASRAFDISYALEKEIEAANEYRKNTIRKEIDDCGCRTAALLKTLLPPIIKRNCDRHAVKVMKVLSKKRKILLNAFNKEIALFKKTFQQEFKKLGVLEVDLTELMYRNPDFKSDSTNLNPSMTYVSEEVTNENWAFGGGMAAGAGIGMIICPGIGAIIGGAIGLFVGSIFSPDIEKIKNQVWIRLSTSLDESFTQIGRKTWLVLHEDLNHYEKEIALEIKRYLKEYKVIIDRKIAECNSLIETHKRKQKEVALDLKQIKTRRKQLESLSKSYNL